MFYMERTFQMAIAFAPEQQKACNLFVHFCFLSLSISFALCVLFAVLLHTFFSLHKISTFNLVLLLKLFCTFDCSFFYGCVCVCCNSIEMTSFAFSLEKMYHIQMIACKLLLAISFYRIANVFFCYSLLLLLLLLLLCFKQLLFSGGNFRSFVPS